MGLVLIVSLLDKYIIHDSIALTAVISPDFHRLYVFSKLSSICTLLKYIAKYKFNLLKLCKICYFLLHMNQIQAMPATVIQKIMTIVKYINSPIPPNKTEIRFPLSLFYHFPLSSIFYYHIACYYYKRYYC